MYVDIYGFQYHYVMMILLQLYYVIIINSTHGIYHCLPPCYLSMLLSKSI